MKRIIFFGGIPFSGKTTLINDYKKNSNDSVTTFSFDAAYTKIIETPIYFFRALGEWNPMFRNEFIQRFSECNHKDEVKFLLTVEERLRKPYQSDDFLDHYRLLRDYAAIVYIVNRINESDHQLFLIEASFTTKNLRKMAFDFFSNAIKDFNSGNTLFFYFNLPIKLHLKRKDRSIIRKKDSIKLTKRTIKQKYFTQEVPEKNEFRNITTHVIKNMKDVANITHVIKKLEMGSDST